MARPSIDILVEEVYDDLRRMAHRQLSAEATGHTLSTTALVHEAYLKLARLDRIDWQNRAHFCAEAARAMRRILVDYAVRRRALKRGGDRTRVDLDRVGTFTDEDSEQLLALHESLEELAREQPRHARIVECRFFAGMYGAGSGRSTRPLAGDRQAGLAAGPRLAQP